MLPSPGAGQRPLSDLDQISAIMSGIHTGTDAINFFARYGSDTPVSFFSFSFSFSFSFAFLTIIIIYLILFIG